MQHAVRTLSHTRYDRISTDRLEDVATVLEGLIGTQQDRSAAQLTGIALKVHAQKVLKTLADRVDDIEQLLVARQRWLAEESKIAEEKARRVQWDPSFDGLYPEDLYLDGLAAAEQRNAGAKQAVATLDYVSGDV